MMMNFRYVIPKLDNFLGNLTNSFSVVDEIFFQKRKKKRKNSCKVRGPVSVHVPISDDTHVFPRVNKFYLIHWHKLSHR